MKEDIVRNQTVGQAEQPATANDIRAIIGPFEDDVVVKILDVHPTAAEVLNAFTWLRSDEHLQRRLAHELHGRAAQVFEILDQEYPEIDGSQM
ncbi:hypothetical protein QYH69_25925 [Paraburkholderia sp. SARCC-3016]|jgi:hypothetical protein|uniref:hypothetical protein n=1 Tax=Paraburkholderia sp. SARCC-3016 TaxID=3058611 RepID=UPI00280980F8|nr:hypothetical protein [Paraburkholderia sp. SARCC-3016]MDQ7980681.1 hypothetical protein [Paraburkholderia sp. SARCC-3016]